MADRLGRDFGWLWVAFGVSAAGSGVGMGALPLVALLVLHASALQVSLLAAVSGIGAALISLPLGSRIEYRRKRPVMMAADLVRFAALASVPVAAAGHALTYAQLCAVGVISTIGAIAFNAASGAHLKALVGPGRRMIAASRFETTNWVASTAGPAVGGMLIGAFGATVTMAVDGVSFLLSAIGVSRIKRAEPSPPACYEKKLDLLSGWGYILGRRDLRALFGSGLLFGGAVTMTGPLIATLMLARLGLSPRDYGLALGLPCLGGLAVIVCADTGTLVFAGIFNPTFTTYRMNATEDSFMARVTSSWSISSKSVYPAFIAGGGLLSIAIGIRGGLAVAGVLCLASVPLLPWGASEPSRTDALTPFHNGAVNARVR